MGCGSSKQNSGVDTVLPVEDAVQDSLRPAAHSTRHNFVWVREDVEMTDVYDVVKTIGSGSMGEVSIVKKKQEASERIAERTSHQRDEGAQAIVEEAKLKQSRKTPRKYACKTINTVRFTDAEILEFINEINILRDLDHPNIIQLFEVIKMKRKMWIVMELCTGGDLTKRIETMTEIDVAVVMEQVVRAIAYMHNRNVCHRDLKLENVLWTSPKENTVKLIDFGLSAKYMKGEKFLRACGTIYSAAPEVLLGRPYSEETDIWSLGCIAFILLSGDYPFLKEMADLMDDKKMDALKNAKLTFGYSWQLRRISNFGRDFVKNCCQKDPHRRWDAKQALEFIKEKWIPHLEIRKKERQLLSGVPGTILEDTEGATSSPLQELAAPDKKRERTRIDTGMVTGMGKFVLYGELKKTILMTMAHTMDKSRYVHVLTWD